VAAEFSSPGKVTHPSNVLEFQNVVEMGLAEDTAFGGNSPIAFPPNRDSY